jgi:hypothetical protein
MKFSSKLALKIAAFLVFSSFAASTQPITTYAEEVKGKVTKAETAVKTYIAVQPLELVANPQKYLDKDVQIQAEFHKFSMLGLDYDKAMRDSKEHISMLIRRPDVAKNHTIPLSELKLILKRELAEKLSDLESGDRVIIKGKVFSTALKDPWVDVLELENLDPEKKEPSEDD